jgi:dTDP-glucose pyrophosphorylase
MTNLELKDLIVAETATVREAMSRLNATASGVLLVADADGRLRGTLSDGDIRRWLLAGRDMDDAALQVANPRPVTLPPHEGLGAAQALMQRHDIHLIPVVDASGRLIDFWTRSHHALRETTPVVVMAGGLGMRLRPLTENTPKPMLEVGGIPLLERILAQFVAQGISRFFFSVNYLGDKIEAHFGDGARWGVEIRYLRETMRLGTGGPLSLLPRAEIASDCVVVINGDVIAEVNIPGLIAHHRASAASMTVCVRSYNQTVPFGVVALEDGRITGIHEKPTFTHHINAGIYCVGVDALPLIPANEPFDMPTLVTRLIEGGRRCVVQPLPGFWIDIGSHDDYNRANEHFSM